VKLLAPLDGWCLSLADVPDDVFAQGMVGEGLAIDPTSNTVVAPCDGEITMLPETAHAVSLRTEQGVEVLVHVGIDSVKLGGRGFEALAKKGQRVRAGDALLRFDLDVLARAARSLVTPVIVSAAEGLRILRRHATGSIRAGDVLLEIEHAAPSPPLEATPHITARPGTPAVAGSDAKRELSIPLRDGLHARPAALIARRARASGAAVTLAVHGKTADARSVTAIMSLGARHGDTISIFSTGANASVAIDDIVAAIDEALRLERVRADTAPEPVAKTAAAGDGQLSGVIAVAGFAVGRTKRLERTQIVAVETGRDAAHESAELERARGLVRTRLSRVAGAGGATRREIVEAHLDFLDDPLLNEMAQEHIAAGKSAGFAWRAAIRQSIASLEAAGDARLRERADDLLDIESHVLLALAGEARPMNLSLPENAVVIADELLPSELVALDRANLQAICLSGGGPTSHVAILAAAMDVPMLVGLGPALRQVAGGEQVIVDAEKGALHVAPSAAAFAQARARAEALRAQRAAERSVAQQECRTRDGTSVEIFANVGSVAEAEAAIAAGAEGCGLLRTEFLFIDREAAPGEAEQLDVYQRIATALGGRPLVLRLMDVGGDKPLHYLPLPHEDNPALGLRGVRTVLRHPQLLQTQLRAALRVMPAGMVRILVPMVTDVSEVRAVRAAIEDIRTEAGIRAAMQLGAMIETPAAALAAERIAPSVDFLSIGSNDLTQYTLAMDRGHPELARRLDALHPAVLKLISLAAAAGQRNGKTVAVCGGVAADPAAVPLLIGFGVRELSVVPAAIPSLKRQVRELNVADCVALAARSLELESAADVRALTARTPLSSGGAR
jgi:phosphoenolpyruvate-protein phosphotransferase